MRAPRARATTRLAALAAVCLLVGTAPAAQQRPGGPRDWTTWLNAVNTHEPGALDDAVMTVGRWSMRELQSASAPLGRQIGDQFQVLQRAVILHVDAAILHHSTEGNATPSGSSNAILYLDGRAVGRVATTVHWEFARRLLARPPVAVKGEREVRLSRQFYRAAAATLQLWGDRPELTLHLDAGRDLLGEDAVLLLYDGTHHQATAGPRMALVRAAASRGPRPRIARPKPANVVVVEEARDNAQRLFRRALAIDPSLAEARIRLANVLSDINRHDEALAQLESAKRAPLSKPLDYLASLLLGRVQRARGEFDAARAAFEHAAALYPGASAPQFGLSEVALARGDRAASLALLPRTGEAAAVDTLDPWWQIDRIHSPSAQELIDDLRRGATP
jgi:tetratricopeptide (TPR) repeat protein